MQNPIIERTLGGGGRAKTRTAISFQAFTLAEILITLGIIGVVAALTIPGLLQKNYDRTAYTKLLKTYAVLNQAFQQAVEEEGTVDMWCDASTFHSGNLESCQKAIPEVLSRYLNIQKLKVQTKYKYRTIKSKYFYLGANNNYTTAYTLKDGTILYFSIYAGDNYSENWCKASKDLTGAGRFYYHCGILLVDINGLSGPNTNNRDLFGFKIFQDGVSPIGNIADENASYWHRFKESCMQDIGSAGSCAGWVLETGNLDYQYCSDLSYKNKRKCK